MRFLGPLILKVWKSWESSALACSALASDLASDFAGVAPPALCAQLTSAATHAITSHRFVNAAIGADLLVGFPRPFAR